MKRRLLFGILAFLTLAVLGILPAEAAKRKVKVAFPRYPGCHERAEDGKQSGYGADAYQLVAKYADWEIEYVGYDKPWSEVLGMLERGEVDLVDFVASSDERRKRFAFSRRPMAYAGTSVRTTPERAREFRSRGVEAGAKVRVAVIRGDSSSFQIRSYALDRNIDFELREFPDVDQAVAACQRGEIDLVSIYSFTQTPKLAHVIETMPVRNHFIARLSDTALMEELDRAMNKLTLADPTWMSRVRATYYPVRNITAYIPADIEFATVKYSRRILERLAEIRGWNVIVKPCSGDFADAELAPDTLGCGISLGSESAGRFQLPAQATGRRRVDLYARRDDPFFKEGLVDLGTPYRIGFVASQAQLLSQLSTYAAETGLSYLLKPAEDIEDVERMLSRGKIDLMLRPTAPDIAYKPVASCGYVEFFIAPPKGERALASSLSDAVKFLHMDDPDFFLRHEKRWFASDDDDARHIRVAAYIERGLCERNDKGEWTGLIPELAQRVAFHANCNLTFVAMSYAEAQRAMAAGLVDFMGAVSRTPERERLYDFSRTTMGPIVYSLMTVLNGRVRPNHPKSWQDMRVGLLRGSNSADALTERLASYGVTYCKMLYNDLHEAELALRRGEVDAVLSLPSQENRDFITLFNIETDLCYFCGNPKKPWIRQSFDEEVGKLIRKDPSWMSKLVSRHLRVNQRVFSLSAPEIAFVSISDREFTVTFDAEIAPLMKFDPVTGEARGFFPELFSHISSRTGLRFKLLPPGSEADVVVSFASTPKTDVTSIHNDDWFYSPACWIRRKSDTRGGCRRVSVVQGDERTLKAVTDAGLKPLVFPTRDEAYEAVAEGRADRMIDYLGVARYEVDELRPHMGLYLQRIDSNSFSYPVALQITSKVDSRLRSILDKAIASYSSGDFDAMIFNVLAIFRPKGVGFYTLVVSLGSVILITGALVLWLLYRTRLAQATNEAKTRFLNNMSHDIRTPMNAILGFARIARDSTGDPPRLRDAIEKIEFAGNRLLRLINGVLDISRIESGTVTITQNPFDVVAYLNSLKTLYDAMCEAKGIRFVVEPPTVRNAWVMTDERHFDQILSNVIGNAIKYTRTGSVTVRATQGEVEEGAASFVFTVEDTGLGMTKEFLERIYVPFAREDRAMGEKIEGTGLGMRIVRQLVDIFGGTIHIESEPGRGTRVTLAFTFALCEPPASASKAEATVGETPVCADPLQGRRVLLVEDNEFNREIARYVLEGMGLLVDEAVNGAEAVEKVRDAAIGHYSWVLMDVQMPVMDGYEAARTIRAFNKTIPIIAMTANAFAEDQETALRAGMNAHLAKPIQPEKLKEALLK